MTSSGRMQGGITVLAGGHGATSAPWPNVLLSWLRGFGKGRACTFLIADPPVAIYFPKGRKIVKLATYSVSDVARTGMIARSGENLGV